MLLISDFLICVSMVGVGTFFALRESCEECGDFVEITNVTTTTTIAPSVLVSKDTVSLSIVFCLSMEGK